MTAVQKQPQEGHLPGLVKFPKKKKGLVVPVAPPPIDTMDLPWRGHGGRAATYSSVEFDRQLDKISMWLEKWSHDERCHVIEGLLRRSNFQQFQFLCTTLQPILHRDFMYTAKSQFPAIQFVPPSTHTSRRLKEKLIYTRQNNYHRIKSAHFQNDEEVKQQLQGKDSVKFPDITAQDHKEDPNSATSSRSPAASRKKLRKTHQNEQFDRWHGDGSNPIYSNTPHIRYIDMPIRRHIQDENSPRMSKLSQSSSSVTFGSDTFRSSLAGGDNTHRKKSNWKSKKQATSPALNVPQEAATIYQWYTESWSDVKRNEFLHKFLLKLDPRQHYFLSSFLAVRQHRDFIALLPEAIGLKIFSYLTVPELLIAARVSQAWQSHANNNELWKSKCQQVTLEVPVSDNPMWKKVFRDNMYLRLNWNQGQCRTVDLKGHTNNVVSVTFDKTRLASGSVDRTIRVWDIATGELLKVLKGHNKGVWCLNFFTKHLLISGAHDGTVKIWNLQSGTCSKTILAHDGPVWALVRHNNTLVTGSQDRTAKVWNIGRCLLDMTLQGHNAAVFAVDMNEDGSLTITGSADRSVRIWDTLTGKCKRIIWVSPTTSIMAVSYSKGFLACSYGEVICLYKVQGGPTKLVRTFNEHIKRIECLKLDIFNANKMEGILVSAGKDGNVIYWDISRENSIQNFIGHRGEPITAIYFDELRIASAAHDHRLKIWDFNI